MKVDLKTAFSRPLRVKDDDPPPKDLENPVPLDCMNIITMRAIAKRVCVIR